MAHLDTSERQPGPGSAGDGTRFTGGYNGLAIVAFVLSCLVPLFPFAPFLAFAFGIMALAQIETKTEQDLPYRKGRWMALTGVIVGATVSALWLYALGVGLASA